MPSSVPLTSESLWGRGFEREDGFVPRQSQKAFTPLTESFTSNITFTRYSKQNSSFYNLHFTDEGTESWKGRGTCLEPGLKPKSMACDRHFA